MTPRKLNIFIGFPSYGGNGGISSEVPNVREWEMETLLKMKADDRIGEIVTKTVADTPITMVRNRFVKLARDAGCDLLMMVDSDQHPTLHAGEPWYKPFWDSSFDFIYERYDKGPHVVAAPYCGPPPHENVYVFRWGAPKNQGDETAYQLDQYCREEALALRGIQEAAAAPTGLILYDLRAFDLIKPPYFRYEWADTEGTEKASTEDVQNTRDISLCGQAALGYNPLFINWDSWIGHWKPWCVGKPQKVTVEEIAESFKVAVMNDRSAGDAMVDVDLKPTRA